ncbi:MAG: AMP phosphorylase [Candidatus Heimdallarchaeota archaeon]|nr:AMP phosphorylase [Candidatus Heimdallarchaeota archaeon]MCK5047822.1 AMP phosphorylase [Candidatus Heimdallarchaeota archaeon]
MKRVAKKISLMYGRSQIVLSKASVKEMNIMLQTPVRVLAGDCSLVSYIISDESGQIVNDLEVGLSDEDMDKLGVKTGVEISILGRRPPNSYQLIKKKFNNEVWTDKDMIEIVQDINKGQLTDMEVEVFTLAQQFLGLSMDELEVFARSIAETGEMIDFEESVFDKHSIGGIPGNKVSLLIVPIIAAAGLLIPKTSSRAITSPSGTADTFEVLAPVEFSSSELLEIAPKVRGMIVWGGKMNMAQVDSILIDRVKKPLGIDPQSSFVASILATKLSMGVDHLIMDVPTGPETKMTTREKASDLGREFIEAGRRLNINVSAALTYGGQPLGRAIGPALEAKEALESLMSKGSSSLREKAIELSGILLEMGKQAPVGRGHKIAVDLLKSGKALAKMREIIAIQGGNPEIKPEEIPLGEHRHIIKAKNDGYIVTYSNQAINRIASTAGCPQHKGSGIILHNKLGDFVKIGDPVIEIFAEKSTKLTAAISLANQLPFYSVEGMILERISSPS